MRLIKLVLPILVVSSVVFSQNKNTSGKEDFIVIDLSKSHPTNRTLDHLYYLTINSIEVELPSDVIEFLELIPDGNDLNVHNKYNSQRIEILKVLYNKRISPQDKEFICNHYLQITDSPGIIPIQPLLQKYIDKGFL